jgi:hypothetical protein
MQGRPSDHGPDLHVQWIIVDPYVSRLEFNTAKDFLMTHKLLDHVAISAATYYLNDLLIHWYRTKQNSLSLSTTEFEIVASARGVQELLGCHELCMNSTKASPIPDFCRLCRLIGPTTPSVKTFFERIIPRTSGSHSLGRLCRKRAIKVTFFWSTSGCMHFDHDFLDLR